MITFYQLIDMKN